MNTECTVRSVDNTVRVKSVMSECADVGRQRHFGYEIRGIGHHIVLVSVVLITKTDMSDTPYFASKMTSFSHHSIDFNSIIYNEMSTERVSKQV